MSIISTKSLSNFPKVVPTNSSDLASAQYVYPLDAEACPNASEFSFDPFGRSQQNPENQCPGDSNHWNQLLADDFSLHFNFFSGGGLRGDNEGPTRPSYDQFEAPRAPQRVEMGQNQPSVRRHTPGSGGMGQWLSDAAQQNSRGGQGVVFFQDS